MGNNPSFVWRSLLESRDLIRATTVWKVGDGKASRLRIIGGSHIPHNLDQRQTKV